VFFNLIGGKTTQHNEDNEPSDRALLANHNYLGPRINAPTRNAVDSRPIVQGEGFANL
jgi:hypothetical protein